MFWDMVKYLPMALCYFTFYLENQNILNMTKKKVLIGEELNASR